MNFVEASPYSVSELSNLWGITPNSVIRRAYAEEIPVKGLLRDVLFVTVKNKHETKGLPAFEDFIKNTETKTHQMNQWTLTLHPIHLDQMIIDGFADLSKIRDKNGDLTIVKAQDQPAKVTPKDCIILGEHVLQLVEKYNIHAKNKAKGAGSKQQNIKPGKTPQERKRENSLLKVIGGFVETKYLITSGNKYRFWKGEKPNIQEIANAFLGELEKAGYSDTGIKSRNLRGIISDSLEQVKNNKIL